jgi:O-antigen/teichoic acid export membrane protein
MLRDIVKGGVYLSFSTIIIKLLAFFYTPILARVLGPSGLGALNLSILMASWFIVFSSFSLQPTITLLISDFKAKNKDISPIIRDSFIIGGSFSILASVLYFLLSDFIAENIFHDPSLVPYLKIASIVIFTTVLYRISEGIIRGFKQFKLYALYESLRKLFIVGVGLTLVVVLKYGVIGAIIPLFISPFILGAYTIYSLRSHFTSKITNEYRKILIMGSWITILSTFLAISTTFDKFFLGHFETKETVGLYVPALTIAMLASVFTPSFRHSMFPYITEAYAQNDFIKMKVYLEQTIKYTLIVVGVLSILYMGLKEEIILLLFGYEYIASIPLLRVLLFSGFFMTTYIIFHTFLVAIGEIKKAISAVSLSMIATAFIYILLVPNFHAMGAAYAVVIQYIILSLGYYLVVKTKIEFNVLHTIQLISTISLFMAGVDLFSSSTVFNVLLSIFSIGIFILVLIKLNFLEKEEIDFVREQINRRIIKKL